MHVNRGRLALHRRAQIDIERAVDPRRQTSLQAHLSGAEGGCLADSAQNFLARQEVAFLGAMAAAVRAKTAALHAYVREINVTVHDVADSVARSAAPEFIGH